LVLAEAVEMEFDVAHIRQLYSDQHMEVFVCRLKLAKKKNFIIRSTANSFKKKQQHEFGRRSKSIRTTSKFIKKKKK
jgi:hypothetical protein